MAIVFTYIYSHLIEEELCARARVCAEVYLLSFHVLFWFISTFYPETCSLFLFIPICVHIICMCLFSSDGERLL